MPAPLPLFLFDGDCGFCRKWAIWLEGRIGGAATFSPYQQVDLAALGLAARDVQSASYWIDERGRPFRGSRSFTRALRRGTGGWRVVGRVGDLAPLRWILVPVYRLVVRNRHRLPAPG